MAGLGDIFGSGGIAPQILLWSVGSQIASGILAPVTTALTQDAWETALGIDQGLYVALSPASLADMVVRNFISLGDATQAAAKSGVRASDFQLLVDDAGNAPGPELLARLSFLPNVLGTGTGPDATSYEQGIAEGDIKDKWAEVIKVSAMDRPSMQDVVQAAIRGQVTGGDIQTLFTELGGDWTYYDLLYNTRGNPPSPTQLLELVRRGLIPQTGLGPSVLSLQQGIAEGDTKDKWFPAYQQLLEYIPPPRTITALERAGAITATQAQSYYADAGMTSDLAAIYSKDASTTKLAGSKNLAESIVLTLYETATIDATQATTMLNSLGYSNAEAAYILEIQDLKYEVTALHSAVGKIGTLYVGRKLTRSSAVEALRELGASDQYQARMFQLWDLEVANAVRVLTESQVADAFKYSVMTQDQATAALVALGYSAFDAWVILSNVTGAALPNEPAQPAPGPGVIG